jgi:LPS-assembly lipoprotein
LSRLVAIVLLTLLAGCGFQLQGSFSPPPDMERTYIAASDRHSQFYRELRRAMLESGVQLVDSQADATAVFTVSYDATDQRVLSVSARNVPTEFEVFYIVEYALDAGEKNLLEVQTLSLTRNYTYDPTLVLGKAREEELLRDAIVDDLVRIILKQISTL